MRRFEWPYPGDLLQMDTKRFARPGHAVTGNRFTSGARKRERVGYEFAHSMIDDHSRLAYTELHRDERAETVTGFVERALEFFESHGGRERRALSGGPSPGSVKADKAQNAWPAARADLLSAGGGPSE